MKALRREDVSLHHYIRNHVLSDFIEEETSIPLKYVNDESCSPVSYVYQVQTDMLPLPTSRGRGLVYLDNATDIVEQTNSITVYDSSMTVINNSNYMIDYIDGRVIAASSSIVPAYVDYKWHYVSIVDEWLDIQEVSDPPIVSIGISDFSKKGFQLGGGKFVPRRVDINIFASNSAEKDDLTEVIFDGLYLKSCAYQTFPKGTMLDWNGTWNTNYEYSTVGGSCNLKFDNVASTTVRVSLNTPSDDDLVLGDLNRYRSRISFDMFHYEES